jgi:hypothetical protein
MLAFNIMHFGRMLRQAGVPVGPGSVVDALDAALAGPLTRREDFYWTLHAIFVKRREHKELFDQAFHIFWNKPKQLEQLMQLIYLHMTIAPRDRRKDPGFRRLSEALFDNQSVQSHADRKSNEIDIDARLTASVDDVLRTKDFEQMTVSEQAQAKAALRHLHIHRRELATRRFRSGHRGHRVDFRRTMRSGLHLGGQFIELARKEHRRREPPLVVLCDISGSCSSYSRMFLHFLHTLASDRSRIHVFLFGTRLTNVTRQLRRRDVDDAMAKVSAAVKDWSGGTRIGSTLREFNFKWARQVLGQGAHVLLMTDGLDRENVDLLAGEMKRLRLSARRIVWLNPLLRYNQFEARAAGIRAMMPFVDEFRPVHSLASLGDLAVALAKPAGSSHDPRKWIAA